MSNISAGPRSEAERLAADQQHANEPAWAFDGDEWVPLVEDTALSQITPRSQQK